MHALHHTDEQMNITTTQRIHILEYVFAPVLVTGPMTILFNLPAPSIAVLASLPTLWTFFTHANVRVSFGPLWWMLASPQYHRIHHSIEPQHLNRNFAAYFPLWDIVFGTAYRPKPGEYPMSGSTDLKSRTCGARSHCRLKDGPNSIGAAVGKQQRRIGVENWGQSQVTR